ncbi:hypothetical protein OG381_47990 [Streptomyces sp. NBC_00490]|uniref:hypothetical protein n=1 Tax=Streptomyces sp. NBC_00490 TaxID=2903657 RepID=UPI002E1997E8
MTPAADRHDVDNIAQSTRAAAQALGHLERALETAGFPAGTAAYRRMAEVLFAQRLSVEQPAGQSADPAVDPTVMAGFEQIALCAGRIYAMLQPYVEVMRRLAALAPGATDPPVPGVPVADAVERDAATIRPPGPRPATPATDAVRAAVLTELRRRGRRAASVSVLARSTRSSAEAVAAVLAGLADDGTVQVRRTGHDSRYLLTPPQPTRRPPPRTARGTR